MSARREVGYWVAQRATADPFLPELTGLVTYDSELAHAAAEIGIAVLAPG